MNTFRERLKWCREKRGWSQLYVSDKTGISNANLSNYERGTREPDLDTLLKLSDIYNTSIDWLVSGKYTNMKRVELIRVDEYELWYNGKRLGDKQMQRVMDFVNGMMGE